MIRMLLCAALATSACGRSSGVPDDQLGNLVVEPKRADTKIDVDRASRETAELGRALAQSYEKLLAELGPHTISIKTQTLVTEAGKPASELSDEVTIENAPGAFHGTYNNSADYGREAIFVANRLYLRPRYQRWHGRPPESTTEPVEIRESFYAAVPATWDLLGFAAELTDRGVVQIAGRSGRKIEVKLSPSADKPAKESLSQRKWREGRSIEALAGTVVLDVEKGAPLAIDLDAKIGFSRDGRSFLMSVKLTEAITNIGTAAEIAAPADGDVVATPGRLREVDDRDYLLQGIAPPTRKNPDTPAAPAGDKPDEPKGDKTDKSSTDKSSDKSSDKPDMPAPKADKPKADKSSTDKSSDKPDMPERKADKPKADTKSTDKPEAKP